MYMTHEFDDIPRTHGRRLEETITLWVEPSTKEKYVRAKEVHKIRVAECMRRVMDAELDRILSAVEKESEEKAS